VVPIQARCDEHVRCCEDHDHDHGAEHDGDRLGGTGTGVSADATHAGEHKHTTDR
jgi:hypothetical protein